MSGMKLLIKLLDAMTISKILASESKSMSLVLARFEDLQSNIKASKKSVRPIIPPIIEV